MHLWSDLSKTLVLIHDSGIYRCMVLMLGRIEGCSLVYNCLAHCISSGRSGKSCSSSDVCVAQHAVLFFLVSAVFCPMVITSTGVHGCNMFPCYVVPVMTLYTLDRFFLGFDDPEAMLADYQPCWDSMVSIGESKDKVCRLLVSHGDSWVLSNTYVEVKSTICDTIGLCYFVQVLCCLDWVLWRCCIWGCCKACIWWQDLDPRIHRNIWHYCGP